MRKKLWKRVVAVSLCSALLLGAVPSQRSIVWAEESTEADETTEPEGDETTEPEATEEPAEAEEQTISLKVSKKTYTADQFRFSKKTFKIGASAKTALSFKVTSGSKYVSVNQSGLVTIKRWTPKGTYKISVTAKATDEYKEAAKIVTVTVKKASTAVMSKVKMSWDLKKNKTVKFSTNYWGAKWTPVDYIPANISKTASAVIKNFKKVSRGKKYKVTFTVVLHHASGFSKSEIDKMVEGLQDYGTWFGSSVLDYQTGENLGAKNNYDVKVTFKQKETGNVKKYYGLKGNVLAFPGEIRQDYTVTYPKEYKDLCIVVWGNHDKSWEGQNVHYDDKLLDKGKQTFYQATTMHGKKVCHGMRVQ